MSERATGAPAPSDRYQAGSPIGLSALLAPLVERWKVLAVAVIVASAAAAAFLYLRDPKYQAVVIAATVSSGPAINLGGSGLGAAALLGGLGAAGRGGLQASPTFVRELMRSRRVLATVGGTEVGGLSIADRVKGKSVPEVDRTKAMRRVVSTGHDLETGLVTLTIVHRDSALARVIAQRVIDETAKAFRETTRAQATQMREAQDARVDSASRQLRTAQRQLAEFRSSNRSVGTYSSITIQQGGLERAERLAEEIYTRAVSDREAAIAKELELTPVLVVVDPLPTVLPRTPRYLALGTVLAGLAALLFAVAAIVVSETLRRELVLGDPGSERLRRAIGRRSAGART